jgi:hypothetical protein
MLPFVWGGGLGIKRFGNYLNSLSKILVFGADDIIFILNLYLCISFIRLIFLFLWVYFVVLGVCILLRMTI